MWRKIIIPASYILTFAIMFFFVPSGAKAEAEGDTKTNLVSIIHLNPVSLSSQINTSGEREREAKPLREFLVPLNEGLNAFLDFASPAHRDITAKDNGPDIRAVFGFNIRLR